MKKYSDEEVNDFFSKLGKIKSPLVNPVYIGSINEDKYTYTLGYKSSVKKE